MSEMLGERMMWKRDEKRTRVFWLLKRLYSQTGLKRQRRGVRSGGKTQLLLQNPCLIKKPPAVDVFPLSRHVERVRDEKLERIGRVD